MISDNLERLQVWRDPIARAGPENMAIDEWLLETVSEPLLRIYDWEGEWVSLGYFSAIGEARPGLGEAGLVRRVTGGGIVDHRIDRTYSLVVPRAFELGSMVGAESYRVIHTGLARAMGAFGIDARVVDCPSESESPACFEKVVGWDLVNGSGTKLAGAAQRRGRSGLLHQGSVVVPGEVAGLFERLAEELADRVETVRREPRDEELAAKIAKYGSREWLERR